MQGRHLLWLGARTTRVSVCQPWKSSCSYAAQRSSTSTSLDRNESPDPAELQREELLRDLKSDPYIQILATPLRRCGVMQLALPRAMMLQMISQRDWKDSLEEDIVIDKAAVPRDPGKVYRRRSRGFWVKQAKKSKEKALLRSQHLIKHKVATSITEKSREHFTNQLANISEQLKVLMRPRPQGKLMPFGLTKESIRQVKGVPRGKSVWCTLNKKIVAQLPERGVHKIVPSTSGPPSNLSELIQEGLEKRVAEEAHLVLQRLKSVSFEEQSEKGWLIRRLKGQEVRGIVEDGRIELRDAREIRLAALLVTDGEVPTLKEDIDSYDLQALFSDEVQRTSMRDSIRKIAIILSKRQRKDRRRKGELVKSSRIKEEGERPAEERRTTDDISSQSREKQPRILAIRRDERIVELCIALWRLKIWHQSGEK